MDYNHITSFLDKFKKILFQKEEIINIVCDTISKEVSHSIGPKDIKIKTPTVFITGSPLLKSEILIHRDRIIKQLNERVPNNRILYIK